MNKTAAYAVIGILLGLSWIFFCLRIYVRFFIIKKPRWDDLLVLLSMLCYTAFATFATGLVANGLGEDIDETAEDAEEFSRGSFYFLFSELFFILGSAFVRVACALMILRITTKKDTEVRWVVHGVVGIMLAYSVAFFFTTLFQCNPVSYFWTFMLESGRSGHENGFTYSHTGGRCLNDNTVTGDYTTMAVLFTVHSAVSALCDCTLGLLPIFLLRRVRVGFKKKAVVVVLLGLGVLAGVAAMIRCPLIIQANRVEFWDAVVPVAITTAIEPALGIISICAATLMPLIKQHILSRADQSDAALGEQQYHYGDAIERGTETRPSASGESHPLSAATTLTGRNDCRKSWTMVRVGEDGGHHTDQGNVEAITVHKTWLADGKEDESVHGNDGQFWKEEENDDNDKQGRRGGNSRQ